MWSPISFLVFQSTLPRRSDTEEERRKGVTEISIHAPAKERPVFIDPPTINRYFNPRSREGATCGVLGGYLCKQFQSTLPRRSDASNVIFLSCIMISIHAPAKERRAILKRPESVTRFQSTLPRRSDQDGNGERLKMVYFNPRSREGATNVPHK